MDSPTPVINWKKNLLFIWLSQLLSIAGFASALPFIPVYIRDTWGITGEKELGVLMSAFYFFGMLSFCISTPIWGALADRFGRKLMLLRACYVDAIIFPCFLLATSPFWLIVARFVASAFTGTVSACQTIIVTTTPREHHGFALGVLSTAIWSGNLIGFAAGGIIVHYCGFIVAFLSCGFMYFIAGLLAHIFVVDTGTVEGQEARNEISETGEGESRESATDLNSKDKDFAKSPVLPLTSGESHKLQYVTRLIWCIFGLLILSAIARKFDEPYIPLMVECLHCPKDDVAFYTGWISALAALGGVFSGAIIGRLCDKYSPDRIAIPALLCSGVTMLAQAFSLSMLTFAGWRFIHYISSGGIEAIYMSILSRTTPAEKQGTVFGMASAIRMVGILTASACSGFIIYYLGIRAIFLTAGITFFIIIPCFWLILRGTPQDIKSEKIN